MKTLLIKIIVMVWGLILFPTLCPAEWQTVDLVEYEGYTGEEISIGWDASEGAVNYEFEAYHSERQTVVLTASTAQTQLTFFLPVGGHYVFRVRACNENGCSDNATSDDPAFATVNGQPRGWRVFTKIQPPGPVVVE